MVAPSATRQIRVQMDRRVVMEASRPSGHDRRTVISRRAATKLIRGERGWRARPRRVRAFGRLVVLSWGVEGIGESARSETTSFSRTTATRLASGPSAASWAVGSIGQEVVPLGEQLDAAVGDSDEQRAFAGSYECDACVLGELSTFEHGQRIIGPSVARPRDERAQSPATGAHEEPQENTDDGERCGDAKERDHEVSAPVSR